MKYEDFLRVKSTEQPHTGLTELHRAIRQLRDAGLTVRLAEGEGIFALWDVGPLKKLGYYEVLRLAHKTLAPPQMDQSMIPLRPWPDLAKDAFR